MKTKQNTSYQRRFSPSQGEVAYQPVTPKKISRFRILVRRMLRPLLCLFCSLTAMIVNGQSLEQLSLEEFLELASRQAINAQEAQLDLQQAEWNYKLYKAGLKPKLMGSANFPNFSKTFREVTQPDGTILFQSVSNNNSAIGLSLAQNIPQTGGTIFLQTGIQRFDDFENDEKLFNGNPIQIGLSQPLFGFNAMKWDRKLEPLRQLEARKKYSADIEDIRSRATVLFFDLLVAHQEAEMAASNEKSNEQLFQIAEERLELGRLSSGDLKQLQLELISAQQSKQRAEQAVRFASASIYNFLGLSYSEELIQPLFPETINERLIDPEEALKQALANRHDATSQQLLLLEAARDVNRAKKENGLNINVNASFGLVRSAKKVSDIYTDPQQEQFVQLQLNVPIIDWGEQKALVGIARSQQAFTQRLVQQQKRSFETEVRQTALEVNFLIQDLQLAKSIQQIALERFDITKESYVLGAISITELTLAQREKDQTQRTYTATLRDYWARYYQLRALTLYDFEKREKIIQQ